MKKVTTIILKFILSTVIFLLISVAILKLTVLDKEYIKDVLKEENYYEKLSQSTKEEMKNYLIQSGFTEEILDNIYTTDDIELAVNNLIEQVHTNKTLSVDTKKLEENLKNKITSYLKDKNVEFTSSSGLDRFVDLIIDIYVQEVGILDYLDVLQNIYTLVSKYVLPVSIVLLVLGIIIFIILLLLKTKYILVPPLFTTSIIYLIVSFYLKAKIDINNLLILSKDLSNVIKYIFLDITNMLNVVAIIFFVVAIILIILRSEHENYN